MALHLRRKDWIAVGVLAVVCTGLAALWSIAPSAWEKATVFFISLFLFLFLAFEALRRIEAWMKMSEYDYQEMESVLALSQQISLRQPLPSMRGWAVSPDFALLILRSIRERRPAVIVDLGSGVSTLVSGYVLEQLGQGKVFGLDHEPAFGAKTRKEIANHQLETWAQVIDAPLSPITIHGQTWQWYQQEAFSLPGPIDLLIVDGPPDRLQDLSRYPALPFLMNRMSPNAVVLVDDAYSSVEKAMVSRWLQEYPEFTAEVIDCEKGAVVLRRGA